MKARVDFPQTDGQRLALAFRQPLEVLRATRLDEVTAVLDAAWAAALAGHWVLGYVAYEAAPAFDPAMQVCAPEGADEDAPPLALFAVYAAPVEADDADTHAAFSGAAFSDATFRCGLWRATSDAAQDMAAIDALRRDIVDGRFYQVNLTTRLRTEFAGDSAALFDALRASQPAAYCIHLQDAAHEILSVSPELFFDWQTDGALTTRPMKGTAPRHADAAADAAAAQSLQASAKDRAENLMIVDLLRNDLAHIAVTGTVCVPQLFDIDALPTAWQMSSTVRCTTRPATTLTDVFRALFPCGSITGAPKIAAMRAITALEKTPRGAYCGAIGLLRPGGHATFNVGIRTVTLDRAGGYAVCGVGSGIVSDSVASDEYAEWLVKRRFLLRASAGFALLETLRLEAGHYWFVARHLERMCASAAYFGFPCERAQLNQALAALAATHATGDWRVRLLCDRHGAVRAEAFALEALPAEIPVVLARASISDAAEFLQHKTTQRDAYQPFAAPDGAFDTLLWNARGELTEFTRGNLVAELDGQRCTPPLSCGLLPGVLRAELLARGAIAERILRVDDLPRLTGLWFINSVRGECRCHLLHADGL